MRVKILLPVFFCAAANAAFANAGLTSAGVTPNTNPAADEPTLAQVAPVAATTNAAVPNAAGANPAAIGGPNAVTGNGTNAAPVATTRVATPPPPPDPATLPVSVIRPLNKAGSSVAAQPTAPAAAASSPTGSVRERADDTPAAATGQPPTRAVAPPPNLRAPSPAALRAETPVRAASDALPAAEATPDAASSSFIFYTGSGIAGAILLLSIGAFLRSRAAEPPLPHR